MGAMTNTANDPYPTGTYVKGDQTRTADTTADAVQAVFDGFKRVQEDSDVASGFAAVNDAKPVDDQDSGDGSDGGADEGSGEDPTPGFEAESPSSTSATPDGPSGQPVDEGDPSRSYSDLF